MQKEREEQASAAARQQLAPEAESAGGPCRLCLRSCELREPSTWVLIEPELVQRLTTFAAVQIIENDGLPTIVCTNCRDLVYTAYEFKCQVEKSDHDLRQAFLTKQSTLNAQWPTVPIVKSHEDASAPAIPCFQNAILESCIAIQDDYAASNHEHQFNLNISNGNIAENVFVKTDVLQQQNVLVQSSSVIACDTSSLTMKNVISDNHNSHDDGILDCQVRYLIEKDYSGQSDESKAEMNNTQENFNQSDDEKPLILRTKRHKCNHCIKSFANLSLLEKHAVIHRQQKIYICYVCDREFDSIEQVKIHAIDIHNVNVGKENILKNTKIRRISDETSNNFENNNSRLEKSEVDKVTKYTCKFCNRIFTSPKLYISHSKCHRSKSSNNKNSLVSESASHPVSHARAVTALTNSEAASHPGDLNTASQPVNGKVVSQTGSLVMNPDGKTCKTAADLPYQNNNAGKSTNSGSCCNENVDDNGDNDDVVDSDSDSKNEDNNPLGANIQCNQCGKFVASQRNLKRHLLTHSDTKYNCSVCNKNFSRQDKLKEHQNLKHNETFGGKSISDDCSSNDKNEGDQKKKMKNNRPYKCSLCSKEFAQQKSLANHEERHKRVREVGKRFLCEVCSKCFAQSGSLVAHMRTHTGVKPYVCNICSRAFTKSTYLQLHLRTHSGEKPYVCQYCSKAFARANTLARHITMHTGEAKYQCQICSKMFRRLTSLNEHMYTHTGQRPYACKICSKSYNNAGSLYAHTKKCKSALEASVKAANIANNQVADNQLTFQLPDSTTMIPPTDNIIPSQILIFTDKKQLDEAISDEVLLSEAQACQFMIANMHGDRPVFTNMLEQFTIQDPDSLNIDSKQFKIPYYGLYPNLL